MKEEFPFLWDDIHKYFPKEKVARLRKKLMEEYHSGEYTDKELMKHYHMSKQTFYDTIERYKDAIELHDFMDESKAPKNPYRKILQEHKEQIKELVRADREGLKQNQQQLENKIKHSNKKIRKEKLEKLKNDMKISLKGCRRIANAFNTEMKEKGEDVRVRRTTVHEIMTGMGMYVRVEKEELDGHLMRPPEPFMEFAMDFTEKVTAGGERAHIFDLLDKYDNEKIILDTHKTQDGDAVICSLEKFINVIARRGVTITVDNGKEFKNKDVLDYFSKHGIFLDFVNKGHPWENAFVERDIRTNPLQEIVLNSRLILLFRVLYVYILLEVRWKIRSCIPITEQVF